MGHGLEKYFFLNSAYQILYFLLHKILMSSMVMLIGLYSSSSSTFSIPFQTVARMFLQYIQHSIPNSSQNVLCYSMKKNLHGELHFVNFMFLLLKYGLHPFHLHFYYKQALHIFGVFIIKLWFFKDKIKIYAFRMGSYPTNKRPLAKFKFRGRLNG